MPRVSYQYGTSPRKYESEYETKKYTTRDVSKKEETKKIISKTRKQNKKQNGKTKKIQEGKIRAGQMVLVLAIFGMLLTLSYREIAIMEMFNQKKDLQNQLSTIQKENGQVEKSITEVESSLDWNSIQQKAINELGMQKKSGTPVSLDKSDNVETNKQFIQEEQTSLIEKIIIFFINRF